MNEEVAVEGSDSFSNEEDQMKSGFFHEVFSNPLNIILLGVCAYLLYKIIRKTMQDDDSAGGTGTPQQEIMPMKKRDFTLEELKKFDGKQGDGRILIAVNGKVFDVTPGKRFYGEGGPYSVFAGRDASRGLGTMCLDEKELKDEDDDLSDLSSRDLDIIKDWENSFSEKYEIVGKLLKKDEKPSIYDDDDDDNEGTGDVEERDKKTD